MSAHQFVERGSGRLVQERFTGDPLVSFLYSRVREQPTWLFRALTSARLCDMLAMLHFDLKPTDPALMRKRLGARLALDWAECFDPPETLDTARKVFERRIRYWSCRPMDPDPSAVVSPADAKMLLGSLRPGSGLFLKKKFFRLDELLGPEKTRWGQMFSQADYAIFRLTPDKYHYNHAPVSGVVADFYELDGVYQSCHPAVLVAQATPHSKNRRAVTIVDTDVAGGTGAGWVAMIEIVALMIGDIVQCHSRERYENPVAMRPGLWLERGRPKSLFRPGSSTVVLLFQPGRVRFCEDLLAHRGRLDADTIYRNAWGVPLTETDVPVRATIAHAVPKAAQGLTL